MNKRTAKKRNPAERKTYQQLYDSIAERFASRFRKKNEQNAALKKRIVELNDQLRVLAKQAWDGVIGGSDEDWHDSASKALVLCDLAQRVAYDPEAHRDVGFEFEPEPGDDVLLLTAAGEALLHPPQDEKSEPQAE